MAWTCVVALVLAGVFALPSGPGGAALAPGTTGAGLNVTQLGLQGFGTFGAGAAASTQAWRELPGPARSAVSGALGREDARFHATRVAGGYALANVASGVSARFDRSGSHLSAAGADVRLSLSSVGYGDALLPLSAVAPRADGNRVVFARPGISEWFLNGPAGLEHGFTLARHPAGARVGRLTLGLALPGATTAVADLDGRGATLRDQAGSLRYTGLWAIDASERRLPAQLSVVGGQLRVSVDDRHARYPVTIDPFVQTAELEPSFFAGEAAGSAVAMSGDTIVVGSPLLICCEGDDGHVGGALAVFERPTTGWADVSEPNAVLRSDGHVAGWSVAISGDTIVAGAPGAETALGVDNAAYVWARPANGWVYGAPPNARLTIAGGNELSDDLEGWSVGISGDTIVVGAPGNGTSQGFPRSNFTGAAFVYVRPATGRWRNATQTAKLTASDGAQGRGLGTSVAISGDTIVAGANGPAIANSAYRDPSYPGAAYLFTRPIGGWVNATQTAKLTASDGAGSDELGAAVAVADDTVVAGAPADDVGSAADQGSAYVFVRPGSGWASGTSSVKLTASDGAAGDRFGSSVAATSTSILASAPLDDVGTNTNQGTAYLFERPAGGWASATQTQALHHTSTLGSPEDDQLGDALAVEGDRFVAGAPGWGFRDGAAYVFELDTTPPQTLITDGPSGVTNDSTPTFTFSSEAGAAFECRVGSGAFASCSSPYTSAALGDGTYTFEVRATDAAGNVGAPASRTFTVATDTTPPETTITSGPSGPTNDNTPTFVFSSEAGATFQCRVDSAAFASCSSPLTTAALADGSHTFQVRASDVAGNTDATPAGTTFVVDTVAPTVGCGSADSVWHAGNVSITCTASDGGSGLASTADASFALSTSVAAGSETANAATGTRQVCDKAGNCATAGPVAGNKVDRKAPSITLTRPGANATYSFLGTLLAPVKVAYSCSDGGSGVAACNGTQPNGATLDTGLLAILAPHSFTVNSTDAAGNTATITNNYTVGL